MDELEPQNFLSWVWLTHAETRRVHAIIVNTLYNTLYAYDLYTPVELCIVRTTL